MATHFKGPILGSSKSASDRFGRGLENVPSEIVTAMDYRSWLCDFTHVDQVSNAEHGARTVEYWSSEDIGTPVGESLTLSIAQSNIGFAQVDCGTGGVNDGIQYAYTDFQLPTIGTTDSTYSWGTMGRFRVPDPSDGVVAFGLGNAGVDMIDTTGATPAVQTAFFIKVDAAGLLTAETCALTGTNISTAAPTTIYADGVAAADNEWFTYVIRGTMVSAATWAEGFIEYWVNGVLVARVRPADITYLMALTAPTMSFVSTAARLRVDIDYIGAWSTRTD